MADPGSAPGPGVVDELLEEVEGEFSLGVLAFSGHGVDVDVHDVLGQDHVALLVVFVLHDEDCVEPEKMVLHVLRYVCHQFLSISY